MRVCLLGPCYPFRGGVVHHTTLLYRHLRREHRVTWYAFRRQYPRWLFPGRSDRDDAEVVLREEPRDRTLDSLNPFSWLRTVRRIEEEKPDLVIVPWWTSFWTPQLWTVTRLLRRRAGRKVLFVCHNLVDHEAHMLSRWCSRAVLANGDHWLVHSREDEARLNDLLPGATVTRAFHPLYDCFRVAGVDKPAAKARLGVRGDVLLVFGFIRAYKGVEDLLRAMPLILKHRKVTLLVVGEWWTGRQAFERTLEALNLDDAVRVVDAYVPSEEVGVYFSAADLVVLPYRTGSASGVVQIAFGLERPVVATRVGALPDVVEDGRTGYLVRPGAPEELADAVIRFFREDRGPEFVENIRTARDAFSWERLVRLIEEAVAGGERASAGAAPLCAPL